MRNTSKKITSLLVMSVIVSFASFCKSDDGNNPDPNPNQVDLPISGKYKWSFNITPQISQTSTHVFSNEKINYTMEGPAYNNAYDMIPESYNSEEGRLVAVGTGGTDDYVKEGVYFVIFLKDISEKSVLLYKKECTSKEQAYDFPVPASTDQDNHGWNTYEKE